MKALASLIGACLFFAFVVLIVLLAFYDVLMDYFGDDNEDFDKAQTERCNPEQDHHR